jgi:hypothetical protein
MGKKIEEKNIFDDLPTVFSYGFEKVIGLIESIYDNTQPIGFKLEKNEAILLFTLPNNSTAAFNKAVTKFTQTCKDFNIEVLFVTKGGFVFVKTTPAVAISLPVEDRKMYYIRDFNCNITRTNGKFKFELWKTIVLNSELKSTHSTSLISFNQI